MLIKIHSKQQPKFTATTVKSYNIRDGVETNTAWYSEINTTDYTAIKAQLEAQGYTAYPDSIKEIETKEYTVFQ